MKFSQPRLQLFSLRVFSEAAVTSHQTSRWFCLCFVLLVCVICMTVYSEVTVNADDCGQIFKLRRRRIQNTSDFQ